MDINRDFLDTDVSVYLRYTKMTWFDFAVKANKFLNGHKYTPNQYRYYVKEHTKVMPEPMFTAICAAMTTTKDKYVTDNDNPRTKDIYVTPPTANKSGWTNLVNRPDDQFMSVRVSFFNLVVGVAKLNIVEMPQSRKTERFEALLDDYEKAVGKYKTKTTIDVPEGCTVITLKSKVIT